MRIIGIAFVAFAAALLAVGITALAYFGFAKPFVPLLPGFKVAEHFSLTTGPLERGVINGLVVNVALLWAALVAIGLVVMKARRREHEG